ncbi:hypothetical protein HPP92_023928 [Vanilla planifolia]|uniref:Coiled-coil domain-containing protein 25 n=1 Tax=Vanilla planifolia TaxID=51239 RepID=A0A835PLY5_VANPL|nr:hypothetical protein HPP92_023928 [Vanilla planifolia]
MVATSGGESHLSKLTLCRKVLFHTPIIFLQTILENVYPNLGLDGSNKVNNVDVVYSPWYNLKKTPSMDVGQVGFHNSKMVRTVRVEKRVNEIVNRLNKTKVEKKPDLKGRVLVREAKGNKRREELEKLEKEKQADLRSYKGLMISEKMTSNKQIASTNKSLQELEDDFM